MKDNTWEIDLKEVFKILRKRLWIILLCAVKTGSAVYGYVTNFVPNVYSASVSMYINNKEKGENSESSLTSASLTAAQKLVDTYVRMIKSDRILDRVIEKTNYALTAAQVRSMLSANEVSDTAMFEVVVTTENPDVSLDIAHAIAVVAPEEIPNIVDGSYVSVVDSPKRPSAPVPPRRVFKAFLGAVIGGVVAALIFVMGNLLDTHVRSEEELEKIGGISVLGTIPDFTQPIKKPKQRGR